MNFQLARSLRHCRRYASAGSRFTGPCFPGCFVVVDVVAVVEALGFFFLPGWFAFFFPFLEAAVWFPFVVVVAAAGAGASLVSAANVTDFPFFDGVCVCCCWVSELSLRGFLAEWSGARAPDGFLFALPTGSGLVV